MVPRRMEQRSGRPVAPRSGRQRGPALLAVLLMPQRAYAPWDLPASERRLVLDVTFESSKDYDITSAYAVRGWNTTEGHMVIRAPSIPARHGGSYGMEVRIERAFTQNFHAQFSLPHFMPRVPHSLYQLTFWAKMIGPAAAMPEVSFMDVDNGYDWVGGDKVALTEEWQHIAMEAVPTLPKHNMHEIQIAFMMGKVPATFYFDDIQLYELDVFSPPPPSPPPPPNVLLWLDAEGGPNGAQVVVSQGERGELASDLSSKAAAHEGSYGFELTVKKVFAQDWFAMLSLPPFLVTDHLRMYSLTFWAKASADPKPRPHIAFQDEDNNYAYISGDYISLSAIWHQYTVNLVVPKELRAHNVIVNIMVGSYEGTYYFDDFQVSNSETVMPPPAPPSPPPSPPPGVLLSYDAEEYARGLINSQAWPEGTMTVLPQSELANHMGSYGLLIEVERPFEHDWHAQVSFHPFTPPDVHHGYVLSFWARATPQGSQPAGPPKVVFHDADDNFVSLKQVEVPLTAEWNMYQVDLAIAAHRQGHSVVVSLWVGEFAGSYLIDDVQVTVTAMFSPPPPAPPGTVAAAAPPSPAPAPGVLQLLLFETSDEDVTPEMLASNGSWTVSIPDARAAHTGEKGLYVMVDRPWGVASLARLLMPRYVPRADRETLLHLSFYAKVEKLRALDPPPTVTLAFLDLHQGDTPIATEEVLITDSWQLHYVVIDLKREHVGHQIQPLLYMGKHAGIFAFDDFEYKEIAIEDGMTWLQRAPERIQALRMRRFELLFLDRDGWPIDYGDVDVQLARHDFEMGVALSTRLESRLPAADYQWLLGTAADHFWAGTLASQLQWSVYEPAQNEIQASYAAAEEMARWSEEQGWLPMSASLFDGAWGDKDHWTNQLACHELEARMHARISRDLTAFKGRFGRYQVWKDTLRSREWIERCGEELLINAWRWAREADATATLCSSEGDVLTPLTLTRAEAYHNALWGLASKGVPLGAIGVQAHFNGEVDASTVKHRLDVLRELQKPVFITELTISGLEPAQHAYEFEKLLRLAFSHDAVAGITIGELWDGEVQTADAAAGRGPGLYLPNKAAKPAVERMDALWREEWSTKVARAMASGGVVDVDGFYGVYTYELRSGDQVCRGEFELARNLTDPRSGGYLPAKRIILRCDWHLSWHYPIWGTPAIISLISVGCLLACYRKRSDLIRKVEDGGPAKGFSSSKRGQRLRMVDTEMEDEPL